MTICFISATTLLILSIFLLADYNQPRIIRFRPLDKKEWRIAFSESDMFRELKGRQAEVIMPAKPIIIRLIRKIKPLIGKEI